MIQQLESINGPYFSYCTLSLRHISLREHSGNFILNIVVKRLLKIIMTYFFLYLVVTFTAAWSLCSLHIIFQTLTNAVTLVLLKWRNVILMPLALILRARTIALVIPHTLGMVSSVKVRSFSAMPLSFLSWDWIDS